MLFVAFARWWYGPGWKDFASRLLARVSKTYLTFSVPILLRTMFSPWRRIVTYGGRGLSGQLRAVLDNVISRCVGFGVRSLALLAAAVIITGTLLGGGLILLLWPTLPVLGPLLVVGGLVL